MTSQCTYIVFFVTLENVPLWFSRCWTKLTWSRVLRTSISAHTHALAHNVLYSEFARVFGVDFFSVISRGSQFKVESFMLRIAKPESFVFLAPSRSDVSLGPFATHTMILIDFMDSQVGKQNAAECIPLIMEPLSAFYNSPLVVLDFQSLYPSVMIAYNYCYSTCLGRVDRFHERYKFGVTELNLPPGLLGVVEKDMHGRTICTMRKLIAHDCL